jgi:glycosyltransferase involved in cell wall biosynthesis
MISTDSVLYSGPVVVYSPQAWCDLWLSKHWIAHELSRHVKVLYVNPLLSPVNPGKAYLYRRFLQPRRPHVTEITPSLWVLEPVAVPFTNKLHAIMQPLNARFGVHQLRLAIQTLALKEPLLITFDASTSFLVGNLGERATVYYCVDPVQGGQRGIETEAELCRRADAVMVTSEFHYQRLLPHCSGAKLTVINHGYDFAGARAIAQDSTLSEPDDLISIPHPRIVYTGSIHDSYLDTELVASVASARPGWSFILVGPYQDNPIGPALSAQNLERLRMLPNIHLLGARPYQRLAHYIRFSDVCMAPYNLTRNLEWDGISPFKMLQYLSQGKPVLVPRLGSLAQLVELVYFYEDDHGFENAIEKAMGEQDRGLAEQRIKWASQHSQERVMERIDRHLLRIVGKQTPKVEAGRIPDAT